MMKYWKYFVALLIAGVGLIWWLRAKMDPEKKPEALDLRTEFKAIQNEHLVKRLIAEKGRDQALVAVRMAHRGLLEKLNEDDQTQAQKLHDDPSALSAFLVRAGKRYPDAD